MPLIVRELKVRLEKSFWLFFCEALAAKMRCGSCHLPTLAGEEQMPRLAGQRIDYMLAQLKAYRDSTRSGADALMANAVANIPDADLVALAHYAASR